MLIIHLSLFRVFAPLACYMTLKKVKCNVFISIKWATYQYFSYFCETNHYVENNTLYKGYYLLRCKSVTAKTTINSLDNAG